MIIQSARLLNYRSYEQAGFNFNKGLNCIFGPNGYGKTNLLEAIYIGSYLKSFRAGKNADLIKEGSNYLQVALNYKLEDQSENTLFYQFEKRSMKFELNDKKLSRKNLIGIFPSVLFLPEDLWIIKQSRTSRLKFFDRMIIFTELSYAAMLSDYNKVIKERNKLLKDENLDLTLLDVYDGKLLELGEKISNIRAKFISSLNDGLKTKFPDWFGEKIPYFWKYQTQLNDKDFNKHELFKKRQLDILSGHSNFGIHRDDFLIYQSETEILERMSHGQQKSLILVMKLVEKDLILEKTGKKPLFLIDDLTSELDPERKKIFFDALIEENEQILITTTEKRFFDQANQVDFISVLNHQDLLKD